VSVYLPRAFAARDDDAVAQAIRDYPLATLITPTDGEPQITHLPLLHRALPLPHGMLIGHVARANPHWRYLANRASLAVFHGPHAYVSPSWYSEPAAMVPTWNYIAVHVHGDVELVDDPAGKLATVQELTRTFETPRPVPWQLQLEGTKLDAMIGAIVAFRMKVTRVDAKFKLSQNRSPADQARVVAALAGEGRAEALATAEWMKRNAGKG
jgi:transcriptional regulator